MDQTSHLHHCQYILYGQELSCPTDRYSHLDCYPTGCHHTHLHRDHCAESDHRALGQVGDRCNRPYLRNHRGLHQDIRTYHFAMNHPNHEDKHLLGSSDLKEDLDYLHRGRHHCQAIDRVLEESHQIGSHRQCILLAKRSDDRRATIHFRNYRPIHHHLYHSIVMGWWGRHHRLGKYSVKMLNPKYRNGCFHSHLCRNLPTARNHQ